MFYRRYYTGRMSLFLVVVIWATVLAAIRIWQYDLATVLLVAINVGGLLGVLLAL